MPFVYIIYSSKLNKYYIGACTDLQQKAFKQVIANKGAGGIDSMQTDELRDYLNANWQALKKDILEGNYKP